MIPSMSSYPQNLTTDWKSSSRNVRSNRPDRIEKPHTDFDSGFVEVELNPLEDQENKWHLPPETPTNLATTGCRKCPSEFPDVERR